MVVPKLNNDIPNTLDAEILARHGFWDDFRRYAFVDRQMDKFDWGNRNAGLIAWRIENAPIDVEIAEAICAIFSTQPYPNAVYEALNGMFARCPAKMTELQTMAAQADMRIPSAFM